MTYRPRAIASALLVLLATLALGACGGGGSKDEGKDGTALIKATFSGDHKVASAKLELNVSADLKGLLPKPVEFKLTGPYTGAGGKQPPKFDYTGSVDLAGKTFSGGLVSNGSALVVKIAQDAYAVPPDQVASFLQSYSQGQPSTGGGSNPLARLGIEPIKLIKNAKIVGDEDIGGTATTHVGAEIDTAALLDAVNGLLKQAGSLGVGGAATPSELTPDQRSAITSAVKQAKIDVWSGKDDHTLRQLDVTLSIVPPSGAAGGLQGIDVKLRYRITEVNQPQTIVVPTDTKPFSQLQLKLRNLLGSLGGLGGSSGLGTTPGAGTPPSATATPGTVPKSAAKSQQKVQRCIDAANGDSTKLQRCLTLLPSR